jgi:hypothetical protein
MLFGTLVQYTHYRFQSARLSPAQAAVLAEEHGNNTSNNNNNSNIDGPAIPETLMMDQYRLVVIAAGIEQVTLTLLHSSTC